MLRKLQAVNAAKKMDAAARTGRPANGRPSPSATMTVARGRRSSPGATSPIAYPPSRAAQTRKTASASASGDQRRETPRAVSQIGWASALRAGEGPGSAGLLRTSHSDRTGSRTAARLAAEPIRSVRHGTGMLVDIAASRAPALDSSRIWPVVDRLLERLDAEAAPCARLSYRSPRSESEAAEETFLRSF